jgi:hypothetical protein
MWVNFFFKFLILINFGYSGDVKGGAGRACVVWLGIP